MIRLGVDVNQKVGNSHMNLLAYLCDVRCYRQALGLLRAGAKADFKTAHRKTLLHLCVHPHNNATTGWSKQDLVELIQALIVEGGVDPNSKDRTGNTFLHLAVQNQCLVFICAFEALASLLNQRYDNNSGCLNKAVAFDVDAQNGRGETVLMIACDRPSHADYLYDSAPHAGDSEGRPVTHLRSPLQVFLEALRPNTGLKDAQGRRVTDRIFRVGKRGSPPRHPNPIKPHLEAYIRSYLQFPVSLKGSDDWPELLSSSGGKSSNSRCEQMGTRGNVQPSLPLHL